MLSTYRVDLTKIEGEGDFSCPKCGAKISPDDETETVYTIVETIIGNDDELADVMKGMMSQKKNLDKLVDKYYKKVMKSEGAVTAAQFWQFENYLLSAIRLLILEELPFIGELDW